MKRRKCACRHVETGRGDGKILKIARYGGIKDNKQKRMIE
jgi:hypothetical protein